MKFPALIFGAALGAMALASCAGMPRSASLDTAAAVEPGYDLLVTNGRIYDGTGNSWYLADLAIRGDRIVEIGTLDHSRAARVLDAKGMAVTPGFIDVHTHADDDLYKLPLAENFTRDGVTTIITGNCGGSVSDVAEYFTRLEADGVAVNVATLVGHNTLLRQIKGNRAWELPPEKMEEGREFLRRAMEAGAVGMSTGLIYTPGTYSATDEIVEFQRVVAQYGGIYATHMRSETGEILAAIDEAVQIAELTGSRLQISHFKMPADMAIRIGGSNTTLAKVYAARDRGLEVWVDQYPYTASSTTISVMLPGWVLEEGQDAARTLLADPAQVEKVVAELEAAQKERLREDLHYAKIASARNFPDLAGLSLREVSQVFKLREQRGADVDWRAIPFEEMPATTMREQILAMIHVFNNGGAGMVYHTMPEAEVENIMRSPLVGICSDSGVREFGAGKPHPRGYGSNARVLGRYVRERNVITLEEAVRKMTGMPALAFRLSDRGLLLPGYKADLAIFDPATVTDHATFDDPHNYSTGFRWVVVNGEIVVENDATTQAKPGQVIRGPGYRPAAKATIGG